MYFQNNIILYNIPHERIKTLDHTSSFQIFAKEQKRNIFKRKMLIEENQ